MNKQELIKLIDDFLIPLGFKRIKKSWYRENDETINIFTIDKSRWGEIYYVYICTNFKDLDNDKYPKFNKAHSIMRAERLGINTEEFLDFEKDIHENERKEKIRQLLEKSIELMNKASTITGFKKILHEINPRLMMIDTETQKYLGIVVV